MAVLDGQAVTTQQPDGDTEAGATKCHPAHGDTAVDGAALDGEVHTAVAAKWPEEQEVSAEPGAVAAEQRLTNFGAKYVLV